MKVCMAAVAAAGKRNRFVASAVLLGALLIWPATMRAQAASKTVPDKVLNKDLNNAAKSAIAGRDLSGVWVAEGSAGRSLLPSGQHELPMTAWGKAHFAALNSGDHKKKSAGSAVDDPHRFCDPLGVPRSDLTSQPIEIVAADDEIYIFYQEDHSWRQIYMDGRAIPETPDSAYLGYSVGKWDGETLVVDTVGLNDLTWLDDAGHPHSDSLHVVERLRKTGSDTLQVSLTIEDPRAYTKTWTAARRIFKSKKGYELAEDYCVAADSLGARKAASSSQSPEK